MRPQYHCSNERRRQAVLAHGSLNGIDYLEVLDEQAPAGSPRQQTLLVRCLKPLLVNLGTDNVRISGGVRITPVEVVWVGRAVDAEALLDAGRITPAERDFLLDEQNLPQPEQILVVRSATAGDFSIYRLCLVAASSDGQPLENFDPLLSCVDFSFKVECPSPFDCKTEVTCPPERFPEPQIDYLARDYASFRRLMLDRLAQTLPDWRERNPADQGIVLVELLAHAADQLSYFLDAVATEAYLGTARQRVSLRRHARLLDYAMHEGCNARVLVHCQVDQGGSSVELGEGKPLLTRLPGQPTLIAPDNYAQALQQHPLVFETLHAITLHAAHNTISFYTWGAQDCCLPKGATRATLAGTLSHLKRGDILIFEEVLSPASGRLVDADPTHRHAVRLTEVHFTKDPLGGRFLSSPTDNPVAVTEIAWAAADALPFPLCISATIDGRPEELAIARGNIVLADHGRTIVDEPLPAPLSGGRYSPLLAEPDLTHRVPYDQDAQSLPPASATLAQDPRRALPDITLHGKDDPWSPQRDLFDSDRVASHFVVEMHENRRAQLRFGNGVTGRQPVGGLTPTYRVGNGRAGNVGAEAIAHVVTNESGIVAVRNPLPAQGGTEPEPLEQVRQFAPQAFRVQERAVTEADYAAVAERHPEVQKAAATRRWTGSWVTMFLAIDRTGGQPVDADFENKLRRFMEGFRLTGHDLKITPPRFVPLDIALMISVAPGYFHATVQQALLEIFSTGDLPNGRRGFFHPDNYTFGQPVYLSQVVATAMQVPGVAAVLDLSTGSKLSFQTLRTRTRFQRWGHPPRGELAAGVIVTAPTEIVRLDNDPNQPENGRIRFFMEGGL
jgi:Baseplate J-like protein